MSDVSNDAAVTEVVEREIKRLGDDVGGLRKSFEKDLADIRRLAEEGKTYGEGEVKSLGKSIEVKLATIQAELKAREDAHKAEDERLKAVEAALNRTHRGAGAPEDEAKTAEHALELKTAGMSVRGELRIGNRPEQADVAEYRQYLKAFDLFVRRGQQALGAEEYKTLTTGNDANGGFLVPPTLSARIIKRVFETSAVRPLVTVETIGTDRLELPLDDDEAGFAWFGEEQTRSETTTPTVGLLTIDAKEGGALPKITQRMLEDASINVEAWLADKAADKIIRAENTAFVSGNTPMRPRGFLTYPNGTGRSQVEQITSATVGAITADDVLGIRFHLKAPYQAGASYAARRSTVGKLALLKDGVGQYLWNPGLRSTYAADSIAGKSLTWMDDMPDIATGALALAYADFKQFYTIVDRLGISVLRDPFTQKGFVVYYFRKRTGGGVVLGEAGKLLVVA